MRICAITAAVAVVFFATAASADTAGQPPAHITRVGKQVYTPRKHVTLVRHFTPTATPTAAYMRAVIIPYEAARWGVSASWLDSRIGCESRYEYGASNPSGAKGAGEFMDSTWARALSLWSRRVVLRSRKSELVRRRVVLLYSDGSRKVVRGRLTRRQVLLLREGRLPRWPSVYNGWANVRAVARAMAGIGRVSGSEWSCR